MSLLIIGCTVAISLLLYSDAQQHAESRQSTIDDYKFKLALYTCEQLEERIDALTESRDGERKSDTSLYDYYNDRLNWVIEEKDVRC